MRAIFLGILTLAAFALHGCAPISRESCINDSSYDIGHAAAMDNADQKDRQLKVSKICGKQGREIDEAEYSVGFAAGTKAFCEPDNGYRWGIAGRKYNGICASAAFSAAYDEGFGVYLVEKRRAELDKRRADIRDRLTGIRDRLASISRTLDEKETLTEERRRQLLREEDRLLLERSDLLAEQRSLPLD